MKPIAVNLTRADAVNRDVPVVPGAVLRGVETDDVGRVGIGFMVEQRELDRGGMFRVDAEVNTLGANRSANRIRSPGGRAKHRPFAPRTRTAVTRLARSSRSDGWRRAPRRCRR